MSSLACLNQVLRELVCFAKKSFTGIKYFITEGNSESSSEDEIEMERVSSTTKEEMHYTQSKNGKYNIAKDR